jgi:hypothetical protein
MRKEERKVQRLAAKRREHHVRTSGVAATEQTARHLAARPPFSNWSHIVLGLSERDDTSVPSSIKKIHIINGLVNLHRTRAAPYFKEHSYRYDTFGP